MESPYSPLDLYRATLVLITLTVTTRLDTDAHLLCVTHSLMHLPLSDTASEDSLAVYAVPGPLLSPSPTLDGSWACCKRGFSRSLAL
ncbi:hypothetical protein H0H93_010370 [Arthromyces matolae]|nr:hypothetical protein H0H93_010370 [Arthromyces matolae]